MALDDESAIAKSLGLAVGGFELSDHARTPAGHPAKLFIKKKRRVIRALAEGANKIVERVMEAVSRRTDLAFQGSEKAMVFAAQKLRAASLKSLTVIVLVDRTIWIRKSAVPLMRRMWTMRRHRQHCRPP